jgi:hypothetical protein
MEPSPDPHAVFAAIQKLSQEQVCALLFAASQHSNDVAERILETVSEKECEDMEGAAEGEEEEEAPVQCKTPELGTQPYQPRTKFRRRRRPVFNKGIVDEMRQW